MTNRLSQHSILVMLATAACSSLLGCDADKGKDGAASASTSAVAPATATATAAPEKKATKAGAFFNGKIPDGVALIKGTSVGEDNATIRIPGSWKSSYMNGVYMAMRKDSKAAVYCEPGGVSIKEIKVLAKRAPSYGKDITLEPESEVATIEDKTKTDVLVGSGTANFFKTDGGELYWMSYTYEGMYGGSKTVNSFSCVMTIKGGVDKGVSDEAIGIMRGFIPPPGKKVVAPKARTLK